jgi:hypothetical protein
LGDFAGVKPIGTESAVGGVRGTECELKKAKKMDAQFVDGLKQQIAALPASIKEGDAYQQLCGEQITPQEVCIVFTAIRQKHFAEILAAATAIPADELKKSNGLKLAKVINPNYVDLGTFRELFQAARKDLPKTCPVCGTPEPHKLGGAPANAPPFDATELREHLAEGGPPKVAIDLPADGVIRTVELGAKKPEEDPGSPQSHEDTKKT